MSDFGQGHQVYPDVWETNLCSELLTPQQQLDRRLQAPSKSILVNQHAQYRQMQGWRPKGCTTPKLGAGQKAKSVIPPWEPPPTPGVELVKGHPWVTALRSKAEQMWNIPHPGGMEEHLIYLFIGANNTVGAVDGAGCPAVFTRPLAGPAWLCDSAGHCMKRVMEPLHPYDGKVAYGVGYARAFARRVQKGNPQIANFVVPGGCAVGDCTLDAWERDGVLYNIAVARSRTCAEAVGGRVAGVFWHQGEADACSKERAAAYEGRIANLIQNLRTDLDDPNLIFIAGELGEAFLDQTTKQYPDAWRYASEINAALRRVCSQDEYTACLPAARTHEEDRLHFNAEGMEDYGTRVGDRWLEMWATRTQKEKRAGPMGEPLTREQWRLKYRSLAAPRGSQSERAWAAAPRYVEGRGTTITAGPTMPALPLQAFTGAAAPRPMIEDREKKDKKDKKEKKKEKKEKKKEKKEREAAAAAAAAGEPDPFAEMPLPPPPDPAAAAAVPPPPPAPAAAAAAAPPAADEPDPFDYQIRPSMQDEEEKAVDEPDPFAAPVAGKSWDGSSIQLSAGLSAGPVSTKLSARQEAARSTSYGGWCATGPPALTEPEVDKRELDDDDDGGDAKRQRIATEPVLQVIHAPPPLDVESFRDHPGARVQAPVIATIHTPINALAAPDHWQPPQFEDVDAPRASDGRILQPPKTFVPPPLPPFQGLPPRRPDLHPTAGAPYSHTRRGKGGAKGAGAPAPLRFTKLDQLDWPPPRTADGKQPFIPDAFLPGPAAPPPNVPPSPAVGRGAGVPAPPAPPPGGGMGRGGRGVSIWSAAAGAGTEGQTEV